MGKDPPDPPQMTHIVFFTSGENKTEESDRFRHLNSLTQPLLRVQQCSVLPGEMLEMLHVTSSELFREAVIACLRLLHHSPVMEGSKKSLYR